MADRYKFPNPVRDVRLAEAAGRAETPFSPWELMSMNPDMGGDALKQIMAQHQAYGGDAGVENRRRVRAAPGGMTPDDVQMQDLAIQNILRQFGR